jgi:hypothetical protein
MQARRAKALRLFLLIGLQRSLLLTTSREPLIQAQLYASDLTVEQRQAPARSAPEFDQILKVQARAMDQHIRQA